jgi:hypothetical protein
VRTWLLVLIFGALTLAGSAGAARAPTLPERTAITRAMPSFVRNYPVGCVSLNVVVSADGRWARVGADYLLEPGYPKSDPCLRYASNGYWILEKLVHWKIVFNGSVAPSCSLGAPREISGGCR